MLLHAPRRDHTTDLSGTLLRRALRSMLARSLSVMTFITFNDTFLNHIGIQTLIHSDFFGNPIELEPVKDMHLLGFNVNLELPTFHPRPWKIRDHTPDSAGSERLRLSGLVSRPHLIRSYTFPPTAIEQAPVHLARLYAQQGHDLRWCVRFARGKIDSGTAECVCVCVTLGVIGILLDLLSFSQQGGSARLTDTTQRRHCQLVVKQCGTPHCVPANFPIFCMA